MKKNIIITGAAGFIGSKVARRFLDEGFNVIGVDDLSGLETNLRNMADALGWKAGQLFMPIRVAITGSKASPPLFETMQVLGRARVLSRLRDAIRRLARNAQDKDYETS